MAGEMTQEPTVGYDCILIIFFVFLQKAHTTLMENPHLVPSTDIRQHNYLFSGSRGLQHF